LVAIAAGPNHRVGNVNEADMNHTGFESNPAQYDSKVGIFRPSALKTNPHGKLPALAMSVINAYGLDIHDSKNKKATHTSGGHTVYRTLINCMIAKNLSMIF
jgi:hypothetical protein